MRALKKKIRFTVCRVAGSPRKYKNDTELVKGYTLLSESREASVDNTICIVIIITFTIIFI